MRPSLHSGRPQTAAISLNAKLNGPWHGKWKEKEIEGYAPGKGTSFDFQHFRLESWGRQLPLLAPACQMGTGQAADSAVKISF